MEQKIFTLTKETTRFTNADNIDYVKYFRSSDELEGMNIDLIEFYNVANPSVIKLTLKTSFGAKHTIDFYKHKREMILQNGIFSFYPGEGMSFLNNPFFTKDGREHYFQLDVSSVSEEDFKILFYYSLITKKVVEEFRAVAG